MNQEKISKQAEDDLKATAISEENIDDAFAKESTDEVEETKVRGAEGLKQVLEGGEKKLYAPDSSSDEELGMYQNSIYQEQILLSKNELAGVNTGAWKCNLPLFYEIKTNRPTDSQTNTKGRYTSKN